MESWGPTSKVTTLAPQNLERKFSEVEKSVDGRYKLEALQRWRSHSALGLMIYVCCHRTVECWCRLAVLNNKTEKKVKSK